VCVSNPVANDQRLQAVPGVGAKCRGPPRRARRRRARASRSVGGASTAVWARMSGDMVAERGRARNGAPGA
jgi:hypothetical protein